MASGDHRSRRSRPRSLSGERSRRPVPLAAGNRRRVGSPGHDDPMAACLARRPVSSW